MTDFWRPSRCEAAAAAEPGPGVTLARMTRRRRTDPELDATDIRVGVIVLGRRIYEIS